MTKHISPTCILLLAVKGGTLTYTWRKFRCNEKYRQTYLPINHKIHKMEVIAMNRKKISQNSTNLKKKISLLNGLNIVIQHYFTDAYLKDIVQLLYSLILFSKSLTYG